MAAPDTKDGGSLTEEQQRVADMMLQGVSSTVPCVYLGGAAGTGKSFLTQHIVRKAREMRWTVAVLATTGQAALNIGGNTVHSFMGLGVRLDGRTPEDVDSLWKEVETTKPYLIRMWRKPKLIVIDEVSMLKGYTLDTVSVLLSRARGRADTVPFGGCRTLLVGDFYQLGPVIKDASTEDDRVYAFHSAVWRSHVQPVLLRTKMRQATDTAFGDMLDRLRSSDNVNEDLVRQLVGMTATFTDAELETAVRLMCRNDQVDALNNTKLAKLLSSSNPPYEFVSEDRGAPLDVTKHLDKNCSVGKKVKLAVGARVILVSNMRKDLRLVNGSQGQVQGFVSGMPASDAKLTDDTVLTVDGYQLVGEPTNTGVLVKFDSLDTPVVVGLYHWKVQKPLSVKPEDIICSRKQVPLILGWCITIHRSQGMTLDRVCAHLDSCFAPGQAYTAISRVREAGHIQLNGVGPKSFLSCRVVQTFYNDHVASGNDDEQEQDTPAAPAPPPPKKRMRTAHPMPVNDLLELYGK